MASLCTGPGSPIPNADSQGYDLLFKVRTLLLPYQISHMFSAIVDRNHIAHRWSVLSYLFPNLDRITNRVKCGEMMCDKQD